MTKNYPVFVGCDITDPPNQAIRVYHQIRDTCNKAGFPSYLPIDHFPPGEKHTSGTNRQVAQSILKQVEESKLVIFYLGFQSADVGTMIGRAKSTPNPKPMIFLYEAEIQNDLLYTSSELWRRTKTPRELMKVEPAPDDLASQTALLLAESRYPKIIKEIIFSDRTEAIEELEHTVRTFFKN